MVNTSTLRHVPRGRVFLGWLLRPDSARETPQVYSSRKTVSSQRPWPLESQPVASRQWCCPTSSRKPPQAPS
eukprot:3062294-Pleurochrysis_carterae.AAC.1